MKKDVQFCPRCGSLNIRPSEVLPVGDPLKKQGFFGYDCLDCGYTGHDFFIVSIEEYEKIKKKNFSKK
jgi:predicted nucleic-acid-binding Zn-ribbon protein